MSDLYQSSDQSIASALSSPVSNKNLFLHVCCGPCAEWPVTSLMEEEFSITAFFYNPNIHPRFEHERRRENAARLMNLRGIPFLEDDSYMEDVWQSKAWEGGNRYPSRCEMCYDIRMKRTAQEAADRGFSAFSTTLLVSPYQDHEALVESAQRAALESGITFVYRDFRPGFREGQNMAREHGLYRQKYCGCILSLEESDFRDKIYQSFEGSAGETRTVL